MNAVIFKDKASAPAGRKFFSLFPGLGYAAGYKVRRFGGFDGFDRVGAYLCNDIV